MEAMGPAPRVWGPGDSPSPSPTQLHSDSPLVKLPVLGPHSAHSVSISHHIQKGFDPDEEGVAYVEYNGTEVQDLCLTSGVKGWDWLVRMREHIMLL